MKNKKTKLILFYILSFILTLAPVVIYVCCNIDCYIKTTSDGFKIGIGLLIVVILCLLKVIGKLRMPRRVVFYAMLCIMSYFLYPLIQDVVVLSALCLVGEILDLVICANKIKKLKEEILIDKTATATTSSVKQEVKAMFEEYMGGGRA